MTVRIRLLDAWASLTVLALVSGLLSCRETSRPADKPRATTARTSGRSVRVTMEALHRAGGVPPGWAFSLPAGDPSTGRQIFLDSGCDACHGVAGEPWAGRQTGPGPELTGMGSHHPVGYFVESILNPDAVIVEGPGYVSSDGHSAMPAYGDMTASELVEVVAYLQSLADPVAAKAAHEASDDNALDVQRAPLPVPPSGQEGACFLVHTYDLAPVRLRELETWFRDRAVPALLAWPGFVNVETYVNATGLRPSLATVLQFRDDAALTAFLESPSGGLFAKRFTELVGSHTSYVVRKPPLYRAPSLSMEEPRGAGDRARTLASSFAGATGNSASGESR